MKDGDKELADCVGRQLMDTLCDLAKVDGSNDFKAVQKGFRMFRYIKEDCNPQYSRAFYILNACCLKLWSEMYDIDNDCKPSLIKKKVDYLRNNYESIFHMITVLPKLYNNPLGVTNQASQGSLEPTPKENSNSSKSISNFSQKETLSEIVGCTEDFRESFRKLTKEFTTNELGFISERSKHIEELSNIMKNLAKLKSGLQSRVYASDPKSIYALSDINVLHSKIEKLKRVLEDYKPGEDDLELLKDILKENMLVPFHSPKLNDIIVKKFVSSKQFGRYPTYDTSIEQRKVLANYSAKKDSPRNEQSKLETISSHQEEDDEVSKHHEFRSRSLVKPPQVTGQNQVEIVEQKSGSDKSQDLSLEKHVPFDVKIVLAEDNKDSQQDKSEENSPQKKDNAIKQDIYFEDSSVSQIKSPPQEPIRSKIIEFQDTLELPRNISLQNSPSNHEGEKSAEFQTSIKVETRRESLQNQTSRSILKNSDWSNTNSKILSVGKIFNRNATSTTNQTGVTQIVQNTFEKKSVSEFDHSNMTDRVGGAGGLGRLS